MKLLEKHKCQCLIALRNERSASFPLDKQLTQRKTTKLASREQCEMDYRTWLLSDYVKVFLAEEDVEKPNM